MAKKKKRKGGASGKSSAARKSAEPSVPFAGDNRMFMERMNRRLAKEVRERGAETPEEAQEILNELMASGVLENPVSAGELSDREEAQELVYRALETEDMRDRQDLLREALEIDEDCADAWLNLMNFNDGGWPELRIYVERAREAARRSLGEEFEESKGHFWGIVETRPYMRALDTLADIAWRQDRFDEVVSLWEEMLELNPNDNQGVRDNLVPLLLIAGKLDRGREILDHYEGERGMCAWNWNHALERFLRLGDCEESRRALSEAIEAAPVFLELIEGSRGLPAELPETYQIGSPEETYVYAKYALPSWLAAEGAVEFAKKCGRS